MSKFQLQTTAHTSSGFTLLEMVIVIGIMTLLVGIAVPVVGASLRISEVGNTKDTMKGLAEGIRNFYEDTDRFPKTLTELVTTKSKPAGWSGPYVNEGFSGPKGNAFYDAWQNAFEYTVADSSTATLRSWGFNGTDEKGKGDDIDLDIDVEHLLRDKNQKLLDEINTAIQSYNASYRTSMMPVVSDSKEKGKKGKKNEKGWKGGKGASGHWHTHRYIYSGKWVSEKHRHNLNSVHSIKDLYSKKDEEKVGDEPSVLDIPLMNPWTYTLDLLKMRSLLDNSSGRYSTDVWGNAFIPGPDPVQYVTSSGSK